MFFRLLLTKSDIDDKVISSINAVVSQAGSPFCVCMMRGAPGVSHVTPIWLKNEMFSHSNIGYRSKEQSQSDCSFEHPKHIMFKGLTVQMDFPI